jgi:dTDP-4-dehydrorhamnose reductase
MDDSHFLIIGAKGQLGTALHERFPSAVTVDSDTLDITSQESLQQFDWSNITVILNAAAYTNVDGAETSEGRLSAWNINASAVGYLSEIATSHNLTLVHVSTDYVFDGTKEPHAEDEPFSPLGVYAQTKAAGDIAASITSKHYILRTSWVIGEGNNFVRTMVGLAAKNISPSVVSDQVGRLTFTATLVDAIEQLLKMNVPFGTYNVSNEGEPASWAAITRRIFQVLGRDDLQVTDTTTADYFANRPEAAPRPLQSTLVLDKIKATGLGLRDWTSDLEIYIRNEQTKEHV